MKSNAVDAMAKLTNENPIFGALFQHSEFFLVLSYNISN
jgi:hypothetical protein